MKEFRLSSDAVMSHNDLPHGLTGTMLGQQYILAVGFITTTFPDIEILTNISLFSMVTPETKFGICSV